MHFFYSIMGLSETKAVDIVLDQNNKVVYVQSEIDCRKASFERSLMPVSLFFTMFDTLTEYEGIDNG